MLDARGWMTDCLYYVGPFQGSEPTDADVVDPDEKYVPPSKAQVRTQRSRASVHGFARAVPSGVVKGPTAAVFI